MKRRDFAKSLAACTGIGTIIPNIVKADNTKYFNIVAYPSITCPIYIDSNHAYEDYSNGRHIPNVTLAFAMNEVNEKNYNHVKIMEARYIVMTALRERWWELNQQYTNFVYNTYRNNAELTWGIDSDTMNLIWCTTKPGNELNLNWEVLLDLLKPNTLFIQNRQDWTFKSVKNNNGTYIGTTKEHMNYIESLYSNIYLNDVCIHATRRMGVFVAPPNIVVDVGTKF